MQSKLQNLARFPARVMTRLSAPIRRLHDDRKGVAAVEFALIAPIMLVMLIGLFECGYALTVDRRTTQVASAIAELTARAPATGLTSADVASLMLIGNQLMKPYPVAPLTVKVVSAKVNATLQIVVDWSLDSSGGTPYARNSSYATPAGLIVNAGDSVILAEASYLYTPPVIHYFLPSSFTLKETFYLKPRNSSCVNLFPINCVTGGLISK